MGYIRNLVKGDIEWLEFLFPSFRGQEIDYELKKKSLELKKLLRTLAEMVDDEEEQDEGSVLVDEEKQHERIVLELWLEELQEAVFNMGDLVDKIHTEALRHKLDGQICEKMEDIRCSLESYVKQGDVLGLAGRTYNMECPVNLQRMLHPDHARMGSLFHYGWNQSLDPTDYFVDESEVYGMDCDKEEIIKLLLSDDASDRQLSVISIEGNGRIGKTTLARLVYNEKRVSHHFHLKAWVRIPDNFAGVTWSILKFLALQDKDLKEERNSLYDNLNDLNQLNYDKLVPRLQQCLEGKRFLLVLDGAKQIPSSEAWKALQYALKDAANGSCIIVTTRNKVIAPMMDAVSTYHMEPLSEERSWSIFAKSAFGGQKPAPDTQLEVIGKEIVQMCHGLPSSVRILGSLLRFKLQPGEWEAILKRLKPSSDSRENVKVVPNLRLPEYLKRCLAYCSIFPQDYEIEKEKLVLLCMAEGFLNEGSERIAELESFFPKSSRSESSFRMCMNNLAAYVSMRYCFRLEGNHPSQIPLNTRYLSLVGGKYENSVIFEAIDRAKLLRTFLPLDHESRHFRVTELQNLLSKLQFLRVLSLSHYHITEIPDSIGNLEHLRYIDLSHTPIKRLPESVCELCNLQSLILSNCHSLTELPENTSNLVNLRYIDLSHTPIKRLPESVSELCNLQSLILSNCHSLTELPENTSNLVNLLDLDLSHTPIKRLPESVCELCNLQSLILSNCHSLTELPENTSNLVNLLDLDLSHTPIKRLPESVSELCHLQSLILSNCHSLTELPENTSNLVNLRYIDLSHTPIKRLPESVSELCNLQSLILSNCHSLTELPENTSNLVNLLNLDVSGSGLSEMPKGMHKLRNLKFLPCFVVGKKGRSALKELRHFENKLSGTLRISKLQNVTYEAGAYSIYSLARLCYLEEIVLEWDENTADPENARKVLEGLRPSLLLKRLTINFYCGPTFPKWLDGTETFHEMVYLRLSNCKSCSTLPSLGKLPKLRVLIIECIDAVEEVGPDFSVETSTRKNTEFKSLERLTFEGMSKWTKWVPLNVLPCLQQLCIRRCPKLRGNLPKELPLVEKVEISESQELVTALTTEASLNNLHYREKIVFKSDDKMTSSVSEGATGSSSLMIEGAEESGESEPETHSEYETASETDESKLELSGTEESGESEPETHSEYETASETEGRKLEQEKSTKDPSPSLFSKEKSLLATTQDTVESSLPVSQTPNFRENADDLTNTCFNQDGPQCLFKSMKVSGLLQLIELPEGVHSLRIEGCDALEVIPEGIMARLNQLQHLYIINCCSLNSLPEDHPPTALKKLYVQNCKKLQIFSSTKRTHQYEFLEHLCIGSSDSLISLSIDFFPNLRSLSIWDCANLQSLSMPVEIQKDLTSLEALEIRDCPKLESFLKGGLSAPNLMSIWLSNCKNLKEIPDRLDTLINSLRSLFINNCPELVLLPKLPSSLSLLSITFCYKLELVMDWGLHSLWNLSRLEIEGGCKNVETFPEDKLLPSNLNSLCISGLLNLKYLNCKGLQHLTALKTLEISCCNKLQPFPEEDLPSSLSLLCIKKCSLLKPKLLNKRKMFD